MFQWNFLCSGCAHDLLSCHWILKCAASPFYCFCYLYTLIRSPPEHSLLQAEELQLSQPLLTCQMLQASKHFCDPLLDSVQTPLPVLETGAAPLKGHNLALPFAELHKAPACPALQPAEVTLNGQY